MRAPAGIAPLLAADQEGGQVQRLQGDGFDRIPSAMEQAEQSGLSLRRNAERWGRQLKLAGIDANLAPVADVVPSRLEQVNQPIGVLRRGYGPDVEIVAEKVAAFTAGMGEAGILTSVKHFPGLGKVRGNTDFRPRVVDSSTSRTDQDLAGFRAAVESGTDMVMMSSAYYALIDRESPAAFSTTVVQEMLRGDLRFTGVVISDDLAAKATQYLAPGERAIRFLRAGGDLMIVGDPSLLADMAAAVRKQAASDPAFADQLSSHAVRVLQMKARRGLADCR
jgi:beta-N-acetylhexosaminidase